MSNFLRVRRKFEKEEKNNRELTKNLYEIIKHMPKKSHPMDVARTAVSVLNSFNNPLRGMFRL